MSFQKISIMGVLGKNAEIKTINNKQYLSFSVAVSNGKDAQGQARPSTWFECLSSYNQSLQTWILQRLTAKSLVYIEGRVSASAYTSTKTGEQIISLNVFATNIEPIGEIAKTHNNIQGGYQQPRQSQPQAQVYTQSPQDFASQDDVPF